MHDQERDPPVPMQRTAGDEGAGSDRERATSDRRLPALSTPELPTIATRPRWHGTATPTNVTAAAERDRAAAARGEAARDRESAARDRRLAAEDRAQAAAERAAATMDSLPGAWLRGPGLAELEREINRVRRGSGRLVVAYIDVDGLKQINDTEGHGAGDAMLKRTVGVLRARLRSYELVIRLGGDEFLCAMSEATISDGRRRFEQISAALSAGPDGGSISVGFGALQANDDSTDVVERADRDLLALRGPHRRNLASVPERASAQN